MTIDSSFSTYSRSDWQRAFAKEVGDESVSSFNFVIDGLEFKPYGSFVEENKVTGRLPKVNDKISLGEIFDFTNDQKPVDQLLNSLAHGFDHPFLMIDKTTSIEDFANVHMDFIVPMFVFKDSDIEVAGSFIKLLDRQYHEKNWTANYISPHVEGNTIGQHVMVTLKTENSVTEMFKQLTDGIDKLNLNDPGKLIVSFTISGQLIKDVIKTRAVKIAFLNWLEQNEHPVKSYTTHITWDLTADYPNEMLLHTNNIIAASMSQADVILMNIGENQNDRGRILRNAAHIAMIESGLGDDPDPVAGSYFIEMVATDLAEKALIN